MINPNKHLMEKEDVHEWLKNSKTSVVITMEQAISTILPMLLLML